MYEQPPPRAFVQCDTHWKRRTKTTAEVGLMKQYIGSKSGLPVLIQKVEVGRLRLQG